MKALNERQMGILRCIVQEPRSARSFTHGPASVSPHIIAAYLDHMADLDLIEAPLLRDGKYTATEAGVLLSAQPKLVDPRSYGNASTQEPYVSEISKVPARGEGAMAAYRIKSLGFGA